MSDLGDGRKSVRRSMTKRNSVIDLLDNGQQMFTTKDGSTYLGEWQVRFWC